MAESDSEPTPSAARRRRIPAGVGGQDEIVDDRAFALDAAAIAVVSVAICTVAHHLAFMSALVAGVVMARFVLFRGPRLGELAFFALCTALGAFNDWSSVTRHHIYAYTVPVYFASVSALPLWMLLYWGLILRFLATLFRWRRLGLGAPPDTLYLGRRVTTSAPLRVLVLVALVVATRQTIYRSFADPLWSWLPFAIALGFALLLLRPDRRRLAVLGAFVVLGPLVEVAYIDVGGLDRYALGWFGGVPLWIVLWWGLAALVWEDISGRLLRRFPARASLVRSSA